MAASFIIDAKQIVDGLFERESLLKRGQPQKPRELHMAQ